jgi:ABC-2 type transport system ATP-binding protein
VTLKVEVNEVRLRYGFTRALDGLSFHLDGGKIYGLLGRNGSGKTSVVSLLAAFRRPTAGTVRVGGADPWRDPSQICLIRESGDIYTSVSVKAAVAFAARVRPSFDVRYAHQLLDTFGLDRTRSVTALSRGQRSALGATLGLASRAPLTIFDEVHLGMDAPSRLAFYDALIADYAERPRTVILSTHLIDEVAPLLEGVVIIDRGRLVAREDAEALRARGVRVTGPTGTVDEFTASAGLTVLSEQTLGGTKAVTLFGELEAADRARAAATGLDLGPVGLQDLFVHLTASAGATR